MKTTPSPWKVIKHTDCLYVTSPTHGAICQIPVTPSTIDEHMANAELIAAAPAILQALEDLIEIAENFKVDGPYMLKAKKAVALATNE